MTPFRSFSRGWAPARKQTAVVTRGPGSRLSYRRFSSTPSMGVDGEEVPSDREGEFYPLPVRTIRETEYPHMNKGTYLDHSGTTIYARSLIDGFAGHLSANLYGNPHSANAPAGLSGRVVDGVRDKALRFLGADPRHFDLVFVANATAAIKLVGDGFRDLAEKTRSGSFWYGFHKDSHTSLVGVRELAGGGGGGGGGSDNSHCFESDAEVEEWLRQPGAAFSPHGGGGGGGVHRQHRGHQTTRRHHEPGLGLGLFAYPGQSNMTGRRLPTTWPGRLRASPPLQNTYSLLDCAALAVTSPLDGVFGDAGSAPDFACVSFYKIFGFPDLGALVVRRDSGHILTLRRYFGGGTVTMVSVLGGSWHKTKGLDSTPTTAGAAAAAEINAAGEGSGDLHSSPPPSYNIHDGLEDGTLPFHSILALGEAIDVHGRIYGSMGNISRHTTLLARQLYDRMRHLRHPNGRPLCHIYGGEDGDDGQGFGDGGRQGATIAFNLRDADGAYIPYSDVERIANENGVYVRSGGICCPGGLFTALEYEPWQLQRAFSAHHACGPDGINLIHQLPTGVVRASLGAMSTRDDIDTFVVFLRETFTGQGFARAVAPAGASGTEMMADARQDDGFYHDCDGPVAAKEGVAA